MTASGDGSQQLWNVSKSGVSNDTPAQTYHEHTKEVYSIDWNKTRLEQVFLTASWDGTVKLWDPNRKASLFTYKCADEFVFSAIFSPLIPHTFGCVSANGCLQLWNTNDCKPMLQSKVHDGEVLTCDWNKYDSNMIITGGSEGLIKGWDIRNMSNELFELSGCEYAIRRIQFSPHYSNIIASASYDYTTRIWDMSKSSEATEIVRHHSEFVYGLEWNPLRENQLADCGWDSLVHVFTPNVLKI